MKMGTLQRLLEIILIVLSKVNISAGRRNARNTAFLILWININTVFVYGCVFGTVSY